jgi:polysaccharide biosynthesis/export protein
MDMSSLGRGARAPRIRRRGAFRWSAALALLAGLALAGCHAPSAAGPGIWFKDYQQPADPSTGTYAIGPGDLLDVRVFGQEGMSSRPRVRSDGMISLPFLNEVQAAGLTPAALANEVKGQLKAFVVAPVVTVSLEEQAPCSVSVVGEVTKPGLYRLDPRSGILQALAAAGGLTEFAARDRIFVLRDRARIRFTFEALTQGQSGAVDFRLRSGDVVVVD